jgi:very-short-patch-repair endonuclease
LEQTKSELERLFIEQLWAREGYRFCAQCQLPYQRGLHRNKRYRRIADFSWHEELVVVEINGGTWVTSKHTTGSGLRRDYEKGNDAALDGWLPLRFDSSHVKSGYALSETLEALRRRRSAEYLECRTDRQEDPHL